MDYYINCNGQTIAKFINLSDRDLCLDALAEAYDDVMFEAAEAAGGEK